MAGLNPVKQSNSVLKIRRVHALASSSLAPGTRYIKDLQLLAVSPFFVSGVLYNSCTTFFGCEGDRVILKP